jgi:hypothetical protein
LHKYKIKDPVYEAEIFLIIASHEELTDFLKTYDSDYPGEVEHYALGKVIRGSRTNKNNWQTKEYFLWIRSFNFYSYQYATLVHEVIHLAMMVFDRKGINIIKDDANEAFCYYADYLFGEVMRAISKVNAKIEVENLKSCQASLDYMKEQANAK